MDMLLHWLRSKWEAFIMFGVEKAVLKKRLELYEAEIEELKKADKASKAILEAAKRAFIQMGVHEQLLASLAAGLAMGLGGIGPGIGLGIGFSKAMEAIGRNPEASGTLFVPYILGLALTEAIGIYALVVSLIILFT